MRVFLTGGTGLIGRNLTKRLLERGDQPVILSRRADIVRRNPEMRSIQIVQGDPAESGVWEHHLEGCDAVFNLVGHNLFEERWSSSVKRKIRDSRVKSTEKVVAVIEKLKQKPKVFVQGSAIGYYGTHGDEELTESSHAGFDFMAVLCREWEEAAAPLEHHGIRLATVRTGIVLAKGEAALGFMTPIFKWLPGGAAPVGSDGSPFKPASGSQWTSWIHIDDIVGIFLLALDNANAHGPINGTSPNPLRNAEFSKVLAKVLHRPFLPVGPPDAMLELVLGEVAKVVTKGQKVLPKRALELGYQFKYPELLGALEAVFAKAVPPAPHAAPKTVSHASSRGHH